MKTIKILIATGLALLTLVGVTLALTWWQPTTSSADQMPDGPNAPLILPGPFLSDDDVADAPYSNPNIWPLPAIDGLIAPGEYAHAGKVTFPGHGGDVEVFLREDGSYLYVAFDIPLFDTSSGSTYADVYLDTDNDGTMGPTDYLLRMRDDGVAREYTPTVSGLWGGETAPISWTASMTTNLIGGGWQVEFQIQYDKLNITAGTFKVLGMGLATINGGTHFWPAGGYSTGPNTWGSLVSSSDWGTFYWKPGPWEDYAPSGMPDFDQRQPPWSIGPISTHCGPVAMANSLWWFDSKFETLTGTMSPVVSDTYRLVTSYGAWDDHDPMNVGGMGAPGLVDDLAWYFDTNGIRTGSAHLGTYVTEMHSGTLRYLRDRGLWDDYIVTLVISPSFEWVADEVMRSEDVVLLLGFYEDLSGGAGTGPWVRVGGHYVNVAGVDLGAGLIAFSDPMLDATEFGMAPGRILSGTLFPHQPIPGHPNMVHNDAGNVSHDIYPMVPTNSPGGTWGPDGYPWDIFPPDWLFGAVNPHPFTETVPWSGVNPIQVEVEFALAVSPYTWKSSGEWVGEGGSPILGTWQLWQDYAPSGVPDFDQKQDNWVGPPFGNWTFCGPVAAANSLWWFDSKFEPSPLGPPQPPPYMSPIPTNDNYPLVQGYDPTGLWDDHDPFNVDFSFSPWPPPSGGPPIVPPEGEFIEDLALWVDTDGVSSGSIHGGTVITDLYNGIEQYITFQNLRQGYVITMVESPDFWWVAEEVEVSEDVILLLGFWQHQGGTDWVRLGGHYVTLPGVDKQGGYVAFSDPWFDRIEQSWPYAGQNTGPFGLAGWPEYTGRVANGWLIPHIPVPGHPVTYHNDAGSVSHDVYRVVGTDSPGGMWGPELYVDFWGAEIENFWGQNGQDEAPPPTPDPVQTEVDWALAVSPVADVWVSKNVNTDTVEPGDWLTFTINFYNDGSLPAEGVIITDDLPSGLINPSWGYWTSNGLTVTARSGMTYAWNIPDLAWMEWGFITITAQIDPAASWSAQTIVTNTVGISTTSVEQYQIPELPNTAQVPFTVTGCVSLTNVTIGGAISGGPGTYTFTTSYSPTNATPPITYLWDNGDTTADSVRSLGLGVHTLTVTATNCSGTQVTDTHIITIECVPITSVDYDWTPYYPDAGEIVTFSLYSLSPATATLPITYTWDFDDGGTGSGAPVTHTYAISGNYDVQFTATNPCSQRYMGHTVNVTGEPDISVSPVYGFSVLSYPDETTPLTLTISNHPSATANLHWQLTEDPLAAWVDTSATSGTVAPGGADDVIVTVDTTGMLPGDSFSTTLRITSNDPDKSPWVSTTVAVNVLCRDVGMVTLGITNTGTIYTNTTVYFSAAVEPVNASAPYTYIAETDAGLYTGQITTTVIPVTFDDVFGITGTHAATITVWNCNMLPIYAISDTITFTVHALGECVELDSVTIDGATSGYPGTYTFTTDYEPFDASIPITYTWDDGGHADTSVRTLGVGTHTLTVSATNPCTLPPVTDTHEIVITPALVCTEVTDVNLTYTNTSTIYTDTVVHFSADIAPNDADMPYTYTIDYGSGPTLPNVAAVDPYLFTYTFPITGTHTVTFSAWNCAMVVPVSDSASVTVSAYGEQDFFIYLPVVLRNY